MLVLRHLVAATAAAAAVAFVCPPAAAQNATTGAIAGVARDADSGDTLPGVLVAINGLGRDVTVMTDERGAFKLTDLAPGGYQVLFHYAGITVRYRGVSVRLNSTTTLAVKIDLSKSGTTYEFSGKPPIVDAAGSKIHTRIGRELLDKGVIPGIDIGSALGVVPGTANDGAGVSFSGSSSPESRINIDGIDTTGVVYGTLGGGPTTDFVEEVDVVTGGYNAEYGRATGAVINIVTRTGTNELRGSVFSRVTPGFLVARRDRTPSASSSIDAESNLAYQADFGAEVGGPIVKDHLWYYAGFAPRLGRTDIDRVVKRQTDCRATNPDGSMTGCDPAQYGDGVPDVDPQTGFRIFEEVERQKLHAVTNQYPLLAKLNWAPRGEHQGQLSFNATPATGTSVGVLGTPAATRLDLRQLTTDLAGKWTSKLQDNATELSAVVGWHRSSQHAGSIDPMADSLPRETYTGVGLDRIADMGYESAAVANGCSEGAGDPYPFIANCPDSGAGYTLGGPGALTDDIAERYAVRADATHRVRATGGSHELKAGIDTEQTRLDHLRALSGGVSYDNQDGQAIYESRWVELAPPGATDGYPEQCGNGTVNVELRACRYLDRQRVVGNTVSWAGYLRDSWQPQPNFTVNAGVRYEEQRLRYASDLQHTVDPFTGTPRGVNAMALTGMWSPRLGVAYDWTKEGKSRAYAHWGRFYEAIPMDINNRSFGGETQYRQIYDGSQCTAGPLDLPSGAGCSGDPQLGQNLFGSGVLIAPGVGAQYMDEYLFGVDYELADDLEIGASYQSRSLGRVLEDVSVDNADTYILANPGEWSGAEDRKLQNRIDRTSDPDEKARLQGRLDQFRRIANFDRPRRDYRAIQLTLTRRFSRKAYVQASYTYSRTTGNYPGLVSTDNGQLDPNISSQFDLIELMANRDGPLPVDRPHYIKLDGYYTFDLSKNDALTVSGRARALSGTPISALGRHYLYGFNESFLLPRGAMGRTDFDYGLDVRVGYGRRLVHGMSLELFADVFNLLDHQGTFQVSQTYTLDSANPVVGGDYADLIFAKKQSDSGAETTMPISRYRNFGNPTVRYAPLTARLGARLTF